MSDDQIFKILKTGDASWATPHSYRGYTASIAYVSGTGYTLTITGPSAPAAATYPTLRNARNAFRHFLLDKPIS